MFPAGSADHDPRPRRGCIFPLTKFLVENHQVIERPAFRRECDDSLLVRFAVDVGSPELLAMLFSLTAADLSAVGPGVWERLEGGDCCGNLRHTMQYLAGDATSPTLDQQFQRRREVAWLGPQKDDPWVDGGCTALPSTVSRRHSTNKCR